MSNRPYYVDELRTYAVWFNGKGGWIIGKLSRIIEGRLKLGYFQNDEIVDCPTNTTSWREWLNRKYEVNINAKLFCET